MSRWAPLIWTNGVQLQEMIEWAFNVHSVMIFLFFFNSLGLFLQNLLKNFFKTFFKKIHHINSAVF